MSDHLKNAIRKFLFEDNWVKYGSEYMSHPEGQGTKDSEKDPTPVDNPDAYDAFNLPVSVSDLMPNRIAIEKPPIEDEDYYPNNPSALSSALAAIGEEVPDSQVQDFYSTVKSNLENLDTLSVEDSEEEPTVDEEEEEAAQAELESETIGTSGNMNTYTENRLRKIIRGLLLNELTDWSNIKLGNHHDALYGNTDDYEPTDEELEAIENGEDPEKVFRGNKREIKGKHVAKYYGKAGDSGVTVGMQRLFANYLKHIGEVSDEDIKDATDYISYHFEELDPTFNDSEVLRTLRTYLFKKIVKDALKADKDLQNSFLSDIITYVKRLRKKDMEGLLQKARSEVANEKQSDAEFVEYLKAEDPDQYSLFLDLFPSYAK